MKFSFKGFFSKYDQTADLVAFTEQILSGKLFLSSESSLQIHLNLFIFLGDINSNFHLKIVRIYMSNQN